MLSHQNYRPRVFHSYFILLIFRTGHTVFCYYININNIGLWGARWKSTDLWLNVSPSSSQSKNKASKKLACLHNLLPALCWFRGRVMAQAVSPWLPTAVSRVRARVRLCGICGDKVALGQVFSVYFGLPCQSSCHQLLHNHQYLSSGAGTIGQ
jgi:hypothetical protein